MEIKILKAKNIEEQTRNCSDNCFDDTKITQRTIKLIFITAQPRDSSISILITSPSSYRSFLGGAGGAGTLGGPRPFFLSFGLAYIHRKR